MPIVGFVGAAIDYSHANSVKTAMQAAADSTALMLSKTASSLTAAQLNTQAASYFKALFTRPEATNVSVTATYTSTSGSQVTREICLSNVKASSRNLIGMSQMTVAVNSHAKWGSARLRVALALDNTGSMNDDGKLPALITATNSLLSQLQAVAANPGDVYVSIIPFSRDVNVGASNYNAAWIDWTQWASPPANVPDMTYGPGDSCPWSTRNDGYTCTTSPSNNDANTSYIPSSGTYKGYICPGVDSNSGAYYNGCYNSTQYSSTGSSATCTGHSNCSCSGSGSSKTCKTNSNYYEHTWIPNNINTWNGCITDRGSASGPVSGNYDENVTAPNVNNTGTLFPAEQYSYCNTAMMSLSYNWSAMTTPGQRHVRQRQHQPGDRPCSRLAVAGRRWPLPDAAGAGPELRLLAGHHPAHRRPQHAGPLVLGPVVHRRTADADLRQHQGRRHHDLHRAGRHRRRPNLDAAAELRDRQHQVLPADERQPDPDDVQHDRHQPSLKLLIAQ